MRLVRSTVTVGGCRSVPAFGIGTRALRRNMRLTLIDLLVLVGVFVAGPAVDISLCQFLGHPDVAPLGVGSGFLVAVVLASLMYRRFHFRRLYLPRCPHCRKRPELYGIAGGGWPREILVCGSCRGVCQVLYDGKLSAEDVSSEVPTLRPHWLYFVGLWRPILSQKG